jgi:hypothetical protein
VEAHPVTFDDDFVRFNLLFGAENIACVKLGLEWPPPERIVIEHGRVRAATDDDPASSVLIMDRMSEITDEERATMTHVCRGAEYFYFGMCNKGAGSQPTPLASEDGEPPASHPEPTRDSGSRFTHRTNTPR